MRDPDAVRKEGKMIKLFLIAGLLFLFSSCGPGRTENAPEKKEADIVQSAPAVMAETVREIQSPEDKKHKVTFVELGSVKCIPCKMMQPIMKEIEQEYAGQVKVLFHDVWRPEGRPYAGVYKVRVIPTQVFLDERGEEYFRHEGFFAKEDLVKILQRKGVK